MKTCHTCHQLLSAECFHKHYSTRDRLTVSCKTCMHKRATARQVERYRSDPEYRKKQLEKMYLNKQEHPDRRLAYNKKSAEINRRTYRQRYSNDYEYRANMKHRSTVRQRGCKDQFNMLSDDEKLAIIDFYINCPKGYHVDHIYPLSEGGQHCLTNLQYLRAKDNLAKGNKIPSGIDIDGTLRNENNTQYT